MCIQKIKAGWHLFKDGIVAMHEVRQALAEIQPVIAGIPPLTHDMAPLVADIAPLVHDMGPVIKDMQPVIHDIQKIAHDVQPVIQDTQVQFRGPDLQDWEQLGHDAAGIKHTVVDALGYLKQVTGNPPPQAQQDTLFAAITEIANVLAPIAAILPHPFGVSDVESMRSIASHLETVDNQKAMKLHAIADQMQGQIL